MDFIETMKKLTPHSVDDEIQWNRIEALFGEPLFSRMRSTPQNPEFHAEGNVFLHTQKVCSALNEIAEFHQLEELKKTALFTAAILHDIGKTKTTKLENGIPVSPHHSQAGAGMARTMLWVDFLLCGTPDKICFRETVCNLIRHHMLPYRLEKQNNPERKAREISALGEQTPMFSWKLLCILSEADIMGRISNDTQSLLDSLQFSRLLIKEANCFEFPYCFADDYSKHAYLSGRNIQPDQKLYDSTWGEVIMMSGLPGTGKDTWIESNCPELPVVSLDDIRKEMNIDPSDNGRAINAAREKAKEYLRNKQPFIWNATNLSLEIRQKQIQLFEQYGAKVRIVYLETDWDKRISRNQSRLNAVPESAVEKMLSITVLPLRNEAQTVEWITT